MPALTSCAWPRTSASRCVATNDLHYTHARGRRRRTRVLLCVQSGSTLADPNRFKFDADDFYLKIPDADARASGATCPRPATTRSLIAERCEARLHRGRATSCRASRPRRARTRSPGSSRRSSAGCTRRYPGGIPDEVREQADYEVGVIAQMGFPGYFLVVADFINWAKEPGHPGRARAAAPAAGVAGRLRHCGITDLDPLRPRPDLRAVPQPRPRLDAGRRRGLRRAPARRGDPLRHREVRRGPRRPDRHLTARSSAKQAAQGLRPRPRLPVLDGRAADQGRCRRR